MSVFVRPAAVVATQIYSPKYSFSDFKFGEQLQKNIAARGYITPTPIQDQAMPPLLSGRDVIGTANTGSGKTAAFLLPLIHKVSQNRALKVLIVAPTRELAVQINDEFRQLARQMGMFSTICIGGVALSPQIRDLSRHPQFVIGTPGRLKDLCERRVLNFGDYSTIVLDEVDRMLDMGFINDVRFIVSKLPNVRQSLGFSATMPETIRGLMKTFLKDPVSIAIQATSSAVNIDRDVVRLQGKPKVEVLHNLLIKEGFDKVLVFGRTKHSIDKLVSDLETRGFRVAAIHGNKSQSQRQKALDQFKHNQIKVLLATDIASRGLDIDDVTHVINYDLPESYEDYIHRIGRTARAGKTGVALTFIN
jgi:ATP-dependent RNA helicase RhlE